MAAKARGQDAKALLRLCLCSHYLKMGGIGGSGNDALDEARLRYKILTLKRYS
ncbi:hypothetical protein COLO4_27458 [Corchorus olitorius]|uniref:Uncharacterized protein n=1 Tax=Corchorus olitorius TaxID=93759 RepID=A0A1R3HR89_9ROSI|nr:hypothetical protein COLO4_27458 [Corchorus olitorius]